MRAPSACLQITLHATQHNLAIVCQTPESSECSPHDRDHHHHRLGVHPGHEGVRAEEEEQHPPAQRHGALRDAAGHVAPAQHRRPRAHRVAQDAPEGDAVGVAGRREPDGGYLAAVAPLGEERDGERLQEHRRHHAVEHAPPPLHLPPLGRLLVLVVLAIARQPAAQFRLHLGQLGLPPLPRDGGVVHRAQPEEEEQTRGDVVRDVLGNEVGCRRP
mmetsp:Transcript_33068/g.81325  ORF Transcript_33068/g.81325 Transcript_33068/m.81325 type:complete len:216 (-) Transcript_33068:222-869(-)